jgi:hypothetical protein
LGEFFFPTIAHFFFSFWGVNCSSKNLQFFIQTFFQLALDLCFWSQYILHQHQETEENIYLGTLQLKGFLIKKSLEKKTRTGPTKG